MVSYTTNFGLTKLSTSESLHEGGKFPSTDRDIIDTALYGAAVHRHIGTASDELAPVSGPTLTLSPSGGTLPAGVTIRYRFTYTDPITGETTASPESVVVTEDPLLDPAAPTHALQSIGGSLLPGAYMYVLTAYVDTTTVETKATNPAAITIPAGTATNQVELTLPALQADQTGYNVYRRAPNEARYYFIGSTTTTEFIDDGIVASTRSLPSFNTTFSTNSVTVSRLGVLPAIPVDGNWTIYRSMSGSWIDTYLTQQSSATTSFIDTGIGTQAGSPPSVSIDTSRVSKILLTDGTEVQGVLPIEMLEGIVLSYTAGTRTLATNTTGGTNVVLPTATTTDAGLMSATDKTTLNAVVQKSSGWEVNGQATDKTLSAYTADAETTAYGTTLTDPTDTPADADALRDDLVANAFPQLRQALTDLNNLRVAYENLRTAHEDLRGVVAALVAAVDDGT